MSSSWGRPAPRRNRQGVQAHPLRQLEAALHVTHRALRRVALLGGDVTRGDPHALLRIDALLRAVLSRTGGTLRGMSSESQQGRALRPAPGAAPDPVQDELASALATVEGGERADDLREHLILRAVTLAQEAGLIAGFTTDGLGVRAVIELPTGRVSYPVQPPNADAISWDDNPGLRRQAVRDYASSVRGADANPAMYELVRAAGRWIAALPPESWQEISGVAVTRTSTGTTITILPAGFTPPGPATRAPGEPTGG